MIDWLWPWMLMLLPLPWVVRRLAPAAHSEQPALRAPFFEDWRQLGQSSRKRSEAVVATLPLLALWLLWSLLVLAAARPVWAK